MSVPSLEDIALFTSIRYIWEHSELQSLIVKRAHTAIKKGDESCEAGDIYNKIDEIQDSITEKMMGFTCLPQRLRVRWIVAFEDFLRKMDSWCYDLAKNLDMNTAVEKKHIIYCIKRIVLDPAGLIDKHKTILRILEESKFIIRFDVSTLFLARHLVEEKELTKISNRVLKEVSKKRAVNMPKLLREENAQLVRRNISDLLSWYSSDMDYWNADVAAGLETAREEIRGYFAGTLALLAARRDLAAILFYMRQQRRLYPESLQEQLQEAADYTLSRRILNEDVLMYLHDNMEPAAWTRLLEKHFVEVFLFVMQVSWRHRPLCARWFVSVKHTLRPTMFRAMFLRMPQVWCQGNYDFYDVMPILQTVWLEAPEPLKADDAFIFEIIPDIFCVKFDVNILSFFLNYYGPEEQRKLLSQIIICLFENKKEDLIPECLETIPKLGLDIDNYKMMINSEFLKMHFVQRWSFRIRNLPECSKYLNLLSRIMKDVQDIDKLKQDLVNDKKFMVLYLNAHWFSEHTYDFLLWCYNGNAELLEAYKSQLLSECVIENVYENIISECGHIASADEGLKNLGFISSVKLKIKENVLNKPEIKKCVLYTALRCEELSFKTFKEDMNFYFKEERKQKVMEKLFLCGEGADAILQLLMPVTFEEDPSLRYPVSDLLESFSQIKKVLFKPYSLADRIESMLSEHGHPNTRELPIEYYRSLDAREMRVARKWVDCVYRCARALLRRDWTEEQLRSAEQRDLTKLSLSLAEQAALDVPVVL